MKNKCLYQLMHLSFLKIVVALPSKNEENETKSQMKRFFFFYQELNPVPNFINQKHTSYLQHLLQFITTIITGLSTLFTIYWIHLYSHLCHSLFTHLQTHLPIQTSFHTLSYTYLLVLGEYLTTTTTYFSLFLARVASHAFHIHY